MQAIAISTCFLNRKGIHKANVIIQPRFKDEIVSLKDDWLSSQVRDIDHTVDELTVRNTMQNKDVMVKDVNQKLWVITLTERGFYSLQSQLLLMMKATVAPSVAANPADEKDFHII
jgi:hypothetical protein